MSTCGCLWCDYVSVLWLYVGCVSESRLQKLFEEREGLQDEVSSHSSSGWICRNLVT